MHARCGVIARRASTAVLRASREITLSDLNISAIQFRLTRSIPQVCSRACVSDTSGNKPRPFSVSADQFLDDCYSTRETVESNKLYD